MMRNLQRIFFSLQIKLLMLFRASVLFKKINQLDWYQGALRQWITGLNLPEKAAVLEVGCATGALSEHMAGLGYMVTAVDASESMITAATSGEHGADYRVADVNSLPFEDNAFDVIVAASLINIVADRRRAMTEMKRVCKPGGMISVLVPAQGFSRSQFHKLAESLAVSGFSELALETWHKYGRKVSKQDIETLYRETGLIAAPAKEYLQGMVFSMNASDRNFDQNDKC